MKVKTTSNYNFKVGDFIQLKPEFRNQGGIDWTYSNKDKQKIKQIVFISKLTGDIKIEVKNKELSNSWCLKTHEVTLVKGELTRELPTFKTKNEVRRHGST